MQLILMVNEFITLVHILREREASATTRGEKDFSAPILQRLLDHNFGLAFDELEDLQDILQEYSGKLKREIDAASLGENRAELLQRQHAVEHIMEKVSEACAMV